MSQSPECIHFLGIGGIGVSALAQLAHARGIRVSGSDLHPDPDSNPAVRRLLDSGITIYTGHRAENLGEGVDLVVATAAASETNPELIAARARGVRVVSRADFLGELMDAHVGPTIAVSGTHGKTTTTGMLGVALEHAGLDPTVFVGGEVKELGGNIRIGSPTGPFIAEACEAYDSFLSLRPDIAIVTNIEADHLDHYKTFDGVKAAFARFLGNVPAAGGHIVACGDDAVTQALCRSLEAAAPVVFYGATHAAHSVASHLSLQRSAAFDWDFEGAHAHIRLSVPGRHNVMNALAAATTAKLLGVSPEAAAAGLTRFGGATRRQEILGEAGGVLVMDDYAHHPTEIRATLAALRGAYPERRLVAVFQPHLYSRTRDFLEEFAMSLGAADALLVTDIYAAREASMEGVRASDIVKRAGALYPELSADYIADRHAIPALLPALTRAGDLVVFLGAGDIREQGEAFLEILRAKS